MPGGSLFLFNFKYLKHYIQLQYADFMQFLVCFDDRPAAAANPTRTVADAARAIRTGKGLCGK